MMHPKLLSGLFTIVFAGILVVIELLFSIPLLSNKYIRICAIVIGLLVNTIIYWWSNKKEVTRNSDEYNTAVLILDFLTWLMIGVVILLFFLHVSGIVYLIVLYLFSVIFYLLFRKMKKLKDEEDTNNSKP